MTSTVKTTTAKKPTAAKKVAAKKVDGGPAEEMGAKFEAFRARGLRARGGSKAVDVFISDEPFIIGEADGFPFEMSLEKPSFKARLAIDAAIEAGSVIRLLQTVFTGYLDPVLDLLDAYEAETGESSADILTGLTVAYMEHFFGQGSTGQVFTKLSI